MAVTTTKTNKPLNPRGNDQSPKGYNRAELYTGKALDFDGVNDVVTGTITISGAKTFCAWINADGTSNDRIISISGGGYSNITFNNNKFNMYDGTNIPETTTTFETGKWYFVVGVQKANDAKIYVNGINQPLGATTWTENTHTGATIAIGRDGIGPAAWYDGKISGVRIFNTALTAAQVADLYNNPEKIVPTGVANSALKLWLPMMEGAGTTAYDGSPVGFTEDIVTGFTNGTTYPLDSFASSGDDITTAIKTNGFGGCVSNGHYYTNGQKVKVKFTYQKNSGNDLRVLFSNVVTGAGAAKSDAQYISASGEFEHTFTMTADGTAYLQLGTGNASHSIDAVITDVYVSPNVSANHGTISGATWTHGVGAPVAQTAVIDWNKGTNLIPYSEELDNSSSAFTLRGFVQNSSTETSPIGTSDAYKFTENDTNSNPALYWLADYSNGNSQTFKVYLKADAATTFSISTVGAVEGDDINVTTEWQQFEVTQSVNTNSGPHIGGFNSIARDSGVVLYVWHPQLSYGDSVYVPTLATAQTSDVLLPQGLTTGRDITGVNLFENVRKQGALNLDGKSWAEVHDNGSLDVTEGISVEAWVYWSGDGYQDGILGRWKGAGERSYLLYAGSSTIVNFYISDVYSTYTSMTTGWRHIVGTYDKTNRKLYVDGVLRDTDAQTIDIETSSLGHQIGKFQNGSNREYPAPIAQPRIYNRALTAEEVERNYNAGKNIYK